VSAPIRILLADDHELVLEGLRSLVNAQEDMEVVASVTCGDQVLEAVRLHTPDVMALDLEMRPLGGLECLERVRGAGLPLRVLILTAYSDGSSMRAALEAGADGYALKTEPPQHTIEALRQVHRGQMVFPAAARRWLVGRRGNQDDQGLTERERVVLARLAEGVTNGEIAGQLGVSENTVKFHLQNLYVKLGVTNRTEAAAHYHRHRQNPRLR
jgi:DNA-binding NarL/FixJ family response regulator